MSANKPQSAPNNGQDDGLDDLLRQLRDQPVPEPRPFFYTRVRARLDAQNALETPRASRTWLLHRPTYALLLGLLVLGVNVGVVLHFKQRLPEQPAVAATHYDAFVAEYQLDPFALPLPQ